MIPIRLCSQQVCTSGRIPLLGNSDLECPGFKEKMLRFAPLGFRMTLRKNMGMECLGYKDEILRLLFTRSVPFDKLRPSSSSRVTNLRGN